MERIDSVVTLTLFLYLLPGFLGAMVYEAVAEGRPKTNFDRLVIALVLTLASSTATGLAVNTPIIPSIKISNDDNLNAILGAFIGTNLVIASLFSVAFAALAAKAANRGRIYTWLQSLKITNRTGRIDVWHEVFTDNRGIWIQVRFKDGRRLIGWPRSYSEGSERKELFVADATWYCRNNPRSMKMIREDVAGPGVYLVDFSGVEAIDLLKGN